MYGVREHEQPNRFLIVYFRLFQPMEVYVDDEAKLTLHGLQQHYVKLKDAEKNRKLFELLDVLEFNQVRLMIIALASCSLAMLGSDVKIIPNCLS